MVNIWLQVDLVFKCDAIVVMMATRDVIFSPPPLKLNRRAESKRNVDGVELCKTAKRRL